MKKIRIYIISTSLLAIGLCFQPSDATEVENMTLPDDVWANNIIPYGREECMGPLSLVNKQLQKVVNGLTHELHFKYVITDKVLLYFSCCRYTNLTHLDLANIGRDITNKPFYGRLNSSFQTIGLPKSLRRLDIGSNKHISAEILVFLENLEHLGLQGNAMITDEGLSTYLICPHKLTSLNLDNNEEITNKGLSLLTNLTRLSVRDNSKITDDGLASFSNLQNLDLTNNQQITSQIMTYQTKLRTLNLTLNKEITDAGLSALINLTELNLTHCSYQITDAGLSGLTNLTELNLSHCGGQITDGSVSSLTNLTNLDLECNRSISDASVSKLTKLRFLGLSDNHRITAKNGAFVLTNLTSLDLSNSQTYNFNYQHLSFFTNLTELNLFNNQNIVSAIFFPVTLRKLMLAYSCIDGDNISSLTNLTYLSANIRITDNNILPLKNLRNLHLPEDTKITQNAQNVLTQLMRCSITMQSKQQSLVNQLCCFYQY